MSQKIVRLKGGQHAEWRVEHVGEKLVNLECVKSTLNSITGRKQTITRTEFEKYWVEVKR